MNVDRLRVLVAVERAGSLTAAAKSLGIGTSAVSQQVTAFEREVGADLLDRSTRPISLTALGHELVGHGQRIVDELERAQATAERSRDSLSGTFTIAALPTVAVAFLAEVVEELAASAPDIDLRIRDLDTNESLDALEAQRIDMAIVDTYASDPHPLPDSVRSVALGVEPLQLFGAKNLLDGATGGQSLSDFADQPWVLAPETASCGRASRHLCRTAGFDPQSVLESNDLLLLRTSVAGGLGITILPRLALFDPAPNTMVLPIEMPNAERSLHAVMRWSTTGRRVEEAVLETVTAVAGRHLEGAPA